MGKTNYLKYVFNPLEILSTKKVLHINPTAPPVRKEPVAARIVMYTYDKEGMTTITCKTVDEIFDNLDSKKNTWINVDGLRNEDVEKFCAHFGIHQLITEDILSIGQRPKMDEINGLLFALMHMLFFDNKNATIETEQISIVLGKYFVISFQEDASRDVFNQLRGKLNLAASKVRQNNIDFLFYSLIDHVVDNYFAVMEQLAEKVEQLEEDIIRIANKRTLAKINMLRKEVIVLKRSIGPVREIVNGILRSESPLIDDRTEKYFKDVYDHIVQATDLAETYRDMMMNLQDLYLSNVNLKLNEVMKVMAIVTCLLAPATVIGGIFGMNFVRIPLLHNQWGFFISVGLMLLIPIWMMYFFRKRGWF